MKFIVKSKTKDFTHRHLPDVQRIYQVMTAGGVDTDLETCALLWDEYSEDYAAGWLGLPEYDEDLFDTVMCKAKSLSHYKGIEI